MQENETIDEFYVKFCGLSNQAFALGDEYLNSKLVWEVLQFLPEILSIKVEVIKGAKDIDAMHRMSWLDLYRPLRPV